MEDSQNRDQFFGDIFNENVEAVRAQRQLGFEERTIKRAFKECGANRVSWGRYAVWQAHPEAARVDFSRYAQTPRQR